MDLSDRGRRAPALLPSGTASNEALHAEIKSGFLQTQQIHKNTLRLKLVVLVLSKALSHALAMQIPTVSQTTSRLLLARVSARSVWSEDTWRSWCATAATIEGIEKANLAFNDGRSHEVRTVRQWILKKPAIKRHVHKRTVFTKARKSSLRTQGVHG